MEKYRLATPVFTLQKKIGVLLMVLSTPIWFFGAYAFAERLPSFWAAVGEYCFLLWWAVLLAGIVVYNSAKNIYRIH